MNMVSEKMQQRSLAVPDIKELRNETKENIKKMEELDQKLMAPDYPAKPGQPGFP